MTKTYAKNWVFLGHQGMVLPDDLAAEKLMVDLTVYSSQSFVLLRLAPNPVVNN